MLILNESQQFLDHFLLCLALLLLLCFQARFLLTSFKLILLKFQLCILLVVSWFKLIFFLFFQILAQMFKLVVLPGFLHFFVQFDVTNDLCDITQDLDFVNLDLFNLRFGIGSVDQGVQREGKIVNF